MKSTVRTQLLLLIVAAAAITSATTTTSTPASNAITADAIRQADPQQSVVTVNHLGGHNACCSGANVFGDAGCLHGEHTHMSKSMNCSRYMLDPDGSELDAFRATKDGLENGNNLHPNNRFCHAWLPDAANSSQLHQVALVCFDPMPDHYYSLFLLKGALALVSVLFLLATLYVYYLIPDLRDTQDKVTCVALGCLLLFMLCLGILQIASPRNLGAVCLPLGAIVYFFSMAYFSWLNVIMWNVWKSSTMAKWRIKERHWYLLNHLYGWSVPLTLSTLLFWHREEHFSTASCFLHQLSSGYFMYIPMTAMLCLNVVLFFWSAWGIHATGQDVSPDKRRALTYKFCLYLKLITLAGITWIFEVLSFYYGDSNHGWNVWLIADVINALHGLGVFVVLVVCRRRIRKELGNKRILCFHTPARWAAETADSEEGGLQVDELKLAILDKEPYDLINVRNAGMTMGSDR